MTKDTKKKKVIPTPIVMLFIIILLVVVGMVYYARQTDQGSAVQEDTEMATTSSPQLSPDDAVAIVNDDKILFKDISPNINELQRLATSRGADPSDPLVYNDIITQATQNYINSKLLLEKAKEDGIAIDNNKVNDNIKNIVEAAGGEEAFNQQLAQVGVSKDRFEEDIMNNLIITTLIDTVATTSLITVTDEDVSDRYTTTKENNPNADIPELEEVKEEIKSQLTREKKDILINDFIIELRKDAEIEIL